MERTPVQKLARVLRVMVAAILICNLIALLFVPFAVCLYPTVSWPDFMGSTFYEIFCSNEGFPSDSLLFCGWAALICFGYAWTSAYTAVLTLFLWICGACTAVILWQGKRVLDTILKGEPFSLDNAANLRRAAACCFLISGAALARLVWGLAYYRNIGPLFSYNALFVPIFLMGGLLFMVMSALFRQAAELKAENDLTI